MCGKFQKDMDSKIDGFSISHMWELNLIHVESGVDTTPANTSQKKGIQTMAGRLVGIFKDIQSKL